MNAYEKMREALIDVVKRLEARVGCDHHTFDPTATTCDGITSVGKCGNIATCAAIFKARAALSAPPRNCDVGTASEQYGRFLAYCKRRNACADCPVWKLWDLLGDKNEACHFIWEQMPYEEGGAETRSGNEAKMRKGLEAIKRKAISIIPGSSIQKRMLDEIRRLADSALAEPPATAAGL